MTPLATRTCLPARVGDGLAAVVGGEDAAHAAAKTGASSPQLRVLDASCVVGGTLHTACAGVAGGAADARRAS